MHSGSNRSACHARDLDSERLCFPTLSADSVGLLSQSLWQHVLIHAMLAFSHSLKLLIVVTSSPQCVRRLDSFDSSTPPRTSRPPPPLRTPFTSSVWMCWSPPWTSQTHTLSSCSSWQSRLVLWDGLCPQPGCQAVTGISLHGRANHPAAVYWLLRGHLLICQVAPLSHWISRMTLSDHGSLLQDLETQDTSVVLLPVSIKPTSSASFSTSDLRRLA